MPKTTAALPGCWPAAAAQAPTTISSMRALKQQRQLRSRPAGFTCCDSSVLDALPGQAALIDHDGFLVQVNAAWRRFAVDNGYADPDAGLGLNYLEVLDAAQLSDDEPASTLAHGIREVLGGRAERATVEYPCHSPTELRWFCATVSPVGAGAETGALVVHLDVTTRVMAEAKLRVVGSAFDGSGEAIVVCDEHLRVLQPNPAYCALQGSSTADLVGKRPGFLAVPEQGQLIEQGLAAHGRWSGELLIPGHKGRQAATARASISLLSGSATDEARYIVWLSNVTRMRELEQTVDELAYRDPVTGLPNQGALSRWIDQRAAADAGDRPMACVRVLLERIRVVNEVYGYSAGDHLLRESARRLQDATRPCDFVARARGNEFMVLLDGIDGAARAAALAAELVARLAEPVELHGRMFAPSAVAGVCLWPKDASSRDELARCSDVALTVAKQQGRASVVPFSHGMRAAITEQLEIESELRMALARREFHLHFQPSVDLLDGTILGVEALLRWKNQTLGLVSPAKFIPVAEESGLILDISEWVLDAACRQMAEWALIVDAPVRLAINLSPVQFLHADVAQSIASAMARYDLPGERLQVEITEGILVRDPERTAQVLHALNRLGVTVALDDFGTGYSSLAYLKRFPIHTIKLDRSFVMAMTPGSVDAHIVQSVIDLAHRLGMECVAEGVEDAAHAALLREWGCEKAQGYYFSMPLPAEDIPWLLACHPRLPVVRAPAR